MTDMLDPSSPIGFDVTRDPATVNPSQRRREIATILAQSLFSAKLSAFHPREPLRVNNVDGKGVPRC